MVQPGRKYSAGSGYRYGFNGQEKDEDINENATTAEYWEYDSRIARRWNVDPITKKNESFYLCFSANPLTINDILGNSGTSTHTDKNGKVLAVYNDNDLGVYKHDNASTKADIEKSYSAKNTGAGGKLMGKTIYWSAFKDDEFGIAGKINFGSLDAFDWIYENNAHIQGYTKEKYLKLTEYMLNAGMYGKYDYKTNGLKKDKDGNPIVPAGYDNLNDYINRGSQIAIGVYAPGRDVGNFFAGRVVRALKLDKKNAFIVLGAFNLAQNDLWELAKHFGSYYDRASKMGPFYGEEPKSNFSQRMGYEGINTPENLKKIGEKIWID